MEKEFIPYELALALKELGFKEKCLASFYTYDIENFKEDKFDYRGKFNIDYSSEDDYIINTDNSYYIAAPTFSQAFKWFRKNYRLSVNIHDFLDDFEAIITQWTLSDNKIVKEFPQRADISYPNNRFDSYEEAELECLKKLIEIVK